MRKLALAILVVTAASPAWAGDDRRSDRWRWEVGAGFWLGSISLEKRIDEDVAAFGAGGHLELGMRRRRWLLTSELGFLSGSQTGTSQMTTTEEKPGGLMSRAGVAARYSVKQWNPSRASAPFGGDLWLEFGAGVQQLRRFDEQERRFSRGDVKLGIGGEFNGHARKFHAGYYYSFSVLMTRVDVPAHHPATCAGPCDTATRPIPFEQTWLFNMGFVFGG